MWQRALFAPLVLQSYLVNSLFGDILVMDLLCDFSQLKAVLGICFPHFLGLSPHSYLLSVTCWDFLAL